VGNLERRNISSIYLLRLMLVNSVAPLSSQSEEHFGLLWAVFDASPDWIFVKDREFRYRLANRAYAEAIGLPITAIIGKTDLEIGFPEDVVFGNSGQGITGFRASSQAALAGETVHLQEIAIAADGTRYTLDVKKTPLRNAAGEVYAILCMARDISDRIQAETNLSLFEQAIAASNIGIVLADAQQPDLPATYVNPAFEQCTGYSAADVIGRNFRLLQGDDSDQPELEQLRASLKAGTSSTSTLRNYRQDGTLFWNELTVSPILDAQQQITHFVGFQKDISDRKATEAALLASETKFRQLVEGANDLIAAWTPDGIITYLSPNFGSFSGYAVADFLGKSFTPLIHPDDLAAVLAMNQSVLTTGTSISNFEFRQLKQDGTVYWTTLSISLLRDGPMTSFQGIMRDVTDRKQAEAKLNVSQQRLAAVIQQSPIGIIEWTPTGQVRNWNAAATKIFGFSAEAAWGQTFHLIVPDHFKSQVEDVFAALLFQAGGTCSVNDNLTQTGQIITCEWHNRPLVNEAHEVVGLLSMVMDITDRKAAEAALREREEHLRNINNCVPGAIYQHATDLRTGDSTFSYISPRCVELFELAPAMIRASADPIWAMIHPDDRLRVQASLQATIHDRTSWLDEFRIITPSGQEKWIQGQSHPSPAPEGYSIQGGIFIDITGRKRTEAQLQQQAIALKTAFQDLQTAQAQLVQSEKMSSLGQLVAGVAHEINNPVSFIYGNLIYAAEHSQDLMTLLNYYQRAYPDPEATLATKIAAIDLDFILQDLPRLIGSMKIGAERIQAIVLSLRTFSRLDEAAYKEANIHQGLDSTLMILQHRLKAEGDRPAIQVTKHYGELPLVNCYAGQLNQVFMNILANAIDALEENWVTPGRLTHEPITPTITIQTAIHPQAVIIHIADNGPGISEAVQQRLFDPFFTTKPIGKGTGMGLSISYQIITEKHQGTLICRSTLGQGTEFVITLPFLPALV
jgi:PAS domain S-box-containing protein